MDDEFIWNLEEEKIKKEKEIEKKKRELRKKKKEELRKNKKRKRIRIIIVFLLIIFAFFIILVYPFFKVNNIEVKGNKYFEDSYIQTEYYNEFDNNISFLNRMSMNNKLKENKYFQNIKTTYNADKQKLTINVDEIKPIYHDKHYTYYMDTNEQIIKGENIFSTPHINTKNMTEEDLKVIAKQLFKLNDKILLSIKSIEKYDSKNNIKKLTLQMYDGNTVYINQSDIHYKMKYYLQIKQILDENKKGPGYLHLDLGDYYEPKN